MTAERLPRFVPAELTAEQHELYDRLVGGRRSAGKPLFTMVDDAGALTGPFNAMLVSPRFGAALAELGAVVRFGSVLSDRVREMAILSVAAHADSAFERYAHEAIGRNVGLSTAELDDLRAGRVPASAAPQEARALAVVFALVRLADLDDELYAAANAELGAEGLFELITLVGYYQALALQLRVYRVQLPPDAGMQ